MYAYATTGVGKTYSGCDIFYLLLSAINLGQVYFMTYTYSRVKDFFHKTISDNIESKPPNVKILFYNTLQ